MTASAKFSSSPLRRQMPWRSSMTGWRDNTLPGLGSPSTGTMGGLVRAKREGHLTVVASTIDQLLSLGFRLSHETHLAILQLADEGE